MDGTVQDAVRERLLYSVCFGRDRSNSLDELMATLDDILEAKAKHCLRRARALCKIYAGEMYGETAKAREAYERLKAEFGLEGLDKKKR